MEKFFKYLENSTWIPKWLRESNRLKHFIYSIPCGLIGGFLFVLGLGIGMEFKDREHGGKFDWLDLLATILGGIIGAIPRYLLILSIL